MPPATLYDVGVITTLYFVILAAFKESMTLNLAQRSFKVIYILAAIESPWTTLYRPLIVTFTLSSTRGGDTSQKMRRHAPEGAYSPPPPPLPLPLLPLPLKVGPLKFS